MNRATLAHDFIKSSARVPWKTFVLEAHAEGDSAALLEDAFGSAAIQDTDDIHMHELAGDVRFVVDHLDERFWSLHTSAPTSAAFPLLKATVEARRDLDWMWLPSDHLRNVWPGASLGWVTSDFQGRRLLPPAERVQELHVELRGHAAPELLRLIERDYRDAVSFDRVAVAVSDEDLGSVEEAVNRAGRFVAKGDSFEFHQTIVRHIVERYRRFVEAVEGNALQWAELAKGGARLSGRPLLIRFSRPIPDFGLFLDQLFSSREPFRLWGVPEQTGPETAEVEAVDLHVGQVLRFDITPRWMRVYLFAGGCGNSVARLASNLQHHFDGALSLVDPQIDALLTLA